MTTAITRRPLLAGVLAVLGVAAVGGLVHEGAHVFTRRYPRTKFDDLLDQLADRESAARLGRAAIAETSRFDPKAAAQGLRTGSGKGSVARAVEADIAQGRLVAVQGWVLPSSLVLIAGIAATVQQAS